MFDPVAPSFINRFQDIEAGRTPPANRLATVVRTGVLRLPWVSVTPTWLGHTQPPELIVGERSELPRHNHAPGVEDELAQFVLVDGVQAND